MKNVYFLLATVLLAFTSCNDDERIIGESNYSTITASIEQKDTKSRLSVQVDNTLEWTNGDKIKVFMSNGDSYMYEHTGNGIFTAVDQEIPNGTSNSDVKGVLYEGYNDDGSYVDGGFVDGKLNTGFAQNIILMSSPENCICLPMWGTWDNGHISFKHLAGILRVKLTDLPADYDLVSVIASNTISGTGVVDDLTVNEPVLEMISGEGLASIRFTPVTGSGDQNKTFYFPLPVGTYESIEVIISKYDENLGEGEFKDPITLAEWSGKEVKRATIYTAALAYQK